MRPPAARASTRLELLRARAAADRIELAHAVQDVSQRLATVGRVARSIGSIAGVFSSRAKMVGAMAAAGAAVARGARNSNAVGGLIARVRAAVTPRVGLLALVAGTAFGVALLLRRARRAPSDGRERAGSSGRETSRPR